MDRRTFIHTSLASCALGALSLKVGAASREPVATTSAGPVAGYMDGGVNAFLGIRYGADTSGAARFMPPRPPKPWRSVQPAQHYGPACPQSRPASGKVLPEGESEDCLRLNVWTPGLRDKKKRPVMVWLHGGGLWRLSAAGDWQTGKELARRGDVVMVSPNHRIGVLGFAHFGDINSKYTGSSHVGMLDLILALKWVRDNIEEFGGDPDNVTIFGQSGGGQKVSLLLAMPQAQGLFHKAVVQSGPAPLTLESAYATDLASRLLGKMGIPDANEAALAAVDLNLLFEKYYELFDEMGGFGVLGVIQDFAPVVDGHFLPTQPFWDEAPSVSHHVPLLIGSTRTEMTEYILLADPNAASMDADAAIDRLKAIFSEDATSLFAHYRTNHPNASDWEVFSLIMSDWPTRLYSLRMADLKADQKAAPVYVYRTDWETNAHNGEFMSPHAVDIQFVLDTSAYTEPTDMQVSERQIMTQHMSSAWLSFARTGRPSVEGGPVWPSYEAAERPTMIFNIPCRIAKAPDQGDLTFMQAKLHKYQLVAGGIS